ncbi:hypothetical protein ACTXK0_05320 [Corynebacterium variabile]|uniref:hypothetical protein n=1 Tax=Corynebacterium variabile TaxID=1727 RepID=UPI003FD6AFD4
MLATTATITVILAFVFAAALAFWNFALDRRLSAAEDLAASLDRDLHAVEQLVDKLLEERAAMSVGDHLAA